jgi:hypothetical protein
VTIGSCAEERRGGGENGQEDDVQESGWVHRTLVIVLLSACEKEPSVMKRHFANS